MYCPVLIDSSEQPFYRHFATGENLLVPGPQQPPIPGSVQTRSAAKGAYSAFAANPLLGDAQQDAEAEDPHRSAAAALDSSPDVSGAVMEDDDSSYVRTWTLCASSLC